MKIDLIAGARPNFMKIAPIIDAIKVAQIKGKNIEFRLVHTGQHYDKNMSGSFFEQLGIPLPDINLEAGRGTQAEQTAKIMMGYESLLQEESTDYCLVVGDVTSTMACSIVAKKINIKVIHVEGGIRSWDLTMPEEINRMVTDSITDYFFTTSETANENLLKNGIPKDRIFYVGNTMIDTLLKHRPNFIKPAIWDKVDLSEKNYIVMTFHRPANVDEEDILKELIDEIIENSNNIPIIFPVHPRTRDAIAKANVFLSDNIIICEPLSYLSMTALMNGASRVFTDSGGLQKEAYWAHKPCITLREETEWPETLDDNANQLVGADAQLILAAVEKTNQVSFKSALYGDGNSASRCVSAINELFQK